MMKGSVLLAAILALSLAGCGRSYVKESKETVIEKPVAAQTSPQVVVQPAAPRSCAVGSALFGNGSMSCQNGYQYRCVDGSWENRGSVC